MIGVDGFRSTAATLPEIQRDIRIRGLVHEDGALHGDDFEYHGRRDGKLIFEECFQKSWATR